jgi:hypothetical protein
MQYSVLAREGRRRDEVLPENKVEAMSSSWLHGKEVSHDAAAWQRRPEERRHQAGEREEMRPLGLMRIRLG